MADQRSRSSSPAAAVQLMELIWPGALVGQAVYVAAKLGIAERLNDGPRSAEAIAAAIGAHAPSLKRLLHALRDHTLRIVVAREGPIICVPGIADAVFSRKL